MPKSDTIEAIMSLNPTARSDFLAEFSPEDLGRYLERLSAPRTDRHKAPREDGASVDDWPALKPTMASVGYESGRHFGRRVS